MEEQIRDALLRFVHVSTAFEMKNERLNVQISVLLNKKDKSNSTIGFRLATPAVSTSQTRNLPCVWTQGTVSFLLNKSA